MTEPKSSPWWTKITRDLVLFAVGVGLIVNEAVLRSGPERPSLLVAYMAMVGAPTVLRYDERRRGR